LGEQLVIAFSEPIEIEDLDDQSVMLLVPHKDSDDQAGLVCWCQFPASLQPLNLTMPCQLNNGSQAATGAICNAVRLRINIGQLINALTRAGNNTVRVQVHGDLIRDDKGRGLDGNHLPPWLPTVPKTGDGIPGGLFESWFKLDTNP
jgi:hypothetical protein